MAGVRTLVIPGSLTEESRDARVATYKIGLIGRAAAIFGIEEIVVYEDPEHPEGRRVARILEYQSTAPYLRKRLFPISDELSEVGVLPPLNLPLHTVPTWTDAGELRFATPAGEKVDIGLQKPAELRLDDQEDPPEPGEQFPVRVLAARADNVLVERYHPDPGEVLGFSVSRAPDLRTALRGREPVVGTGREGEPFAKKHLAPEGITLVFGSPERGIEEILGQPPGFPMINTVPAQGTRTVRTEEAVLASLGLVHGVARGLPA